MRLEELQERLRDPAAYLRRKLAEEGDSFRLADLELEDEQEGDEDDFDESGEEDGEDELDQAAAGIEHLAAAPQNVVVKADTGLMH